MEELLHPLTLRFSDRVLERDYRAYRLRAFFRAIDTRFLAAQTLLAGAFFLLQPYTFPSIALHWANVGYPAICLANLTIIFALPWPLYELHRHRIQLLFRALVDGIVVRGLPTWSPPVPVRSLGNFAIHLVLTSGAGCLNWASLGWPLLLQYHVPYNLLAVTVFSHVLAPHACAVITQTARGRSAVRATWSAVSHVTGALSHLRLMLLTAATTTTSATTTTTTASAATTAEGFGKATASAGQVGAGVGGSGGGSPLLSSSPSSSSSLLLDDVEGMCWVTVSLVQLVFGLLLPTALVYTLERSSREHFLRTAAYTFPSTDSRVSEGRGSGRGPGVGAGEGGAAGAASATGAAGASTVDGEDAVEGAEGSVDGGAGVYKVTADVAGGQGPAADPGDRGHSSAQAEPLRPRRSSPAYTRHSPSPPPPDQPSPEILARLRAHRHQWARTHRDVGGGSGSAGSGGRGSFSPLDWAHRALAGFLVLLLVLLVWEFQLHLRLLLRQPGQVAWASQGSQPVVGGGGSGSVIADGWEVLVGAGQGESLGFNPEQVVKAGAGLLEQLGAVEQLGQLEDVGQLERLELGGEQVRHLEPLGEGEVSGQGGGVL